MEDLEFSAEETSATEEYLQQYRRPSRKDLKRIAESFGSAPAKVEVTGGCTIPKTTCQKCEQQIWLELPYVMGGCRMDISRPQAVALGIDLSKTFSDEPNGCANQGLFQFAKHAVEQITLINQANSQQTNSR